MRFGASGSWLAASAALLTAAVIGLVPVSVVHAQQGAKKKITIGFVAKSQTNPVFQAAHQGAKDAVKELADAASDLAKKFPNVELEVNIQTPPDEDAQKQAQAVEQLANSGVDAIAVSCSNANTLAPAIDKAVAAGVPVMCFDSDSPKSKRFAYYGTDDTACGTKVAQELAKAMGDKGTVVILAGNQAAPNLQTRQKAVRDELGKHAGIKIIDTVYHEETPDKAAQALQREQTSHPEITGWAMIGGWPLFTRDALKWEPGTVKVVSVDALPPQLSYLKSGHVDLLLAQDCYGWGHRSVEILLDKVVNNKNPEKPMVIDPLTPVAKNAGKDEAGNIIYGADDFAKKWDKWLGK